MKCENCVYCYKGDGDQYARCHWTDDHGEDSLHGTPWDVAPCEEEEEDEIWIDGEQW